LYRSTTSTTLSGNFEKSSPLRIVIISFSPQSSRRAEVIFSEMGFMKSII
jgi:hypothetical protein